MNKEKLEKLILSGNEPDLFLAFHLLVGKTADEVRYIFNVNGSAGTIVLGVGKLYRHLFYKTYKTSSDCVLFIGTNLFITSLSRIDVDLTI